MVCLYSSTNTGTPWKKPSFILSEISDFHIIDNLSIAIHAFIMLILASPSVDEILQSRYVIVGFVLFFGYRLSNGEYRLFIYIKYVRFVNTLS